NAPYSDMNGYGHFLAGQLWFQGYWGLFVLVLLLLSAALWVRGVDDRPRQRLARMRRRMRGKTGLGLAAAVLAFAAVGGFLFWNTNIRNDYVSPDGQLDRQARYEKEYKRYEHLPQPKIVASRSDVDLRPETQSMTADVVYNGVNPHAPPIADVHGQMGDDEPLVSADLDGQTLARHDEELGYRICRLAQALQPGERREFRFRVDYHPNGITTAPAPTQFVANGSFFNSRMFPSLGYIADVEI